MKKERDLTIQQYKVHTNIFMQIKFYTQMRDKL